MRTILGAMLSAIGVGHLHFARDGQAGAALLEQLLIDVMFVDYEMPGMNGLALLSHVRGLSDERRFMPIIMLTGHSDMRRLNAARDRGVNEFLAKPVTGRNIVLRLAAVIDRPRPFIHCESYFGPDRRRRATAGYQGPLRRLSDEQSLVEL